MSSRSGSRSRRRHHRLRRDERDHLLLGGPHRVDRRRATAGKKISVGLVTDIGGLNDRSFNSLANKGLEDAKSELGVDGRVMTSKSNSDYMPNLTPLARQKTDLIIGVGFLMADAVNTVAKKFPERSSRSSTSRRRA